VRYTNVSWVEMFVEDAAAAAASLAGRFGLHPGPPVTGAGAVSVLAGQGGVRVLLTEATAPEHPARSFVQRHGDGVAGIACDVTDVEEAFATAVGHGARVVSEPADRVVGGEVVRTATVAGIGDLHHTLVADGPVPHSARDGALRKIDHVALCVPAGQLESTVEFYRVAFGFSAVFEKYIEVGNQAMNSQVVQDRDEVVSFTLLEPDTSRERGQIDEFVDRHGGAGVQHVAFLTDDIVAAVDAWRGRGVEFLHTPDTYYSAVEEAGIGGPIGITRLRDSGVLIDREAGGYLYQIFTRSTHPRGTLFFELIQRCDAKLFGSNNIQALYEAVERERALGTLPRW
jgi:4-hydroxymandelate synthase